MGKNQFLYKVAALVAAVLGVCPWSWSANPDGDLTFCHFGPKMKVLEPVIAEAAAAASRPEKGRKPAPKPAAPKDPCTGTAKVQGIRWECGAANKTSVKIGEFRKKLAELAVEECSKHCRRRAPGCEGKMEPPTQCGLATDREDAVALGKRLGCRSDCAGSAFIFCSLYDAGFRSEDPKIARQAPNCRCVRSGS